MGFEPMQLSLSELETDPLDQLGHECKCEKVTLGVLLGGLEPPTFSS